MSVTRERILKDMRRGIVEIHLNDKDESLILKATLVNIVMPPDKIPEANYNGPLFGTNLVACFDTEKKEWLTFNIEHVSDYKGFVKLL